MTPAKACKHCGKPIRWVGGFRQPMDAEPEYFVVEPAGEQTAYTDKGEFHRGHFGKVRAGVPWAIGYRPHLCASISEDAKGAADAK